LFECRKVCVVFVNLVRAFYNVVRIIRNNQEEGTSDTKRRKHRRKCAIL
jgi:hypothetical protein